MEKLNEQPRLTEAEARELAAGDRHYVARPDRIGEGWHVWDCVSDHRVEFNLDSGVENHDGHVKLWRLWTWGVLRG